MGRPREVNWQKVGPKFCLGRLLSIVNNAPIGWDLCFATHLHYVTSHSKVPANQSSVCAIEYGYYTLILAKRREAISKLSSFLEQFQPEGIFSAFLSTSFVRMESVKFK